MSAAKKPVLSETARTEAAARQYQMLTGRFTTWTGNRVTVRLGAADAVADGRHLLLGRKVDELLAGDLADAERRVLVGLVKAAFTVVPDTGDAA